MQSRPAYKIYVDALQDDLIDEVGTFVAVAELLHQCGAYKVFVIATHGLLSLDAPQLIQDSYIDEVM